MNPSRFSWRALLGLVCVLGVGHAAPRVCGETVAVADTFSKAPTADEVSQARVFEESLVPMGGKPADAAQIRALADALAAYQKARIAAGPSAASEVDPGAFEQFLLAYPDTPWRVSLLTNLGVEFYHRGEFSKALDAWQQAWNDGKDETAPAAVAIVDRALGELARMEARLGRVSDLKALFAEAGNRQVKGLGASAYYGAKGGLANMEAKPQVSFKCGPWALDSILSLSNPAHPFRDKIYRYPSTDHGVSLAAVATLAKEMKMDLVPAQRVNTDAAVPVPAVVNWKLGHYGALLRHEGGRYLLQDPTFGSSQWIGQKALDEESSGYFLVAAATLKTGGWQAVSDEQAQKVWGKGYPSGYPPPPPPPPPDEPPDDPPCDDCPCDDGMAKWRIRLSEVDLAVTDTPLFYQPPIGPVINFHVSYEQRDANQPATFSYSNVSAQWNFNWITTLTFDSNDAYVNYGNSGQETFAGFTTSTASSGVSDYTLTRLVKAGTSYQLVAPDGGMKVFGLADGSGRYYMTSVVDTLGNAVTLKYDSQFRLTTITDAIGQASTLSYGNSIVPLAITKITDPFGRTASFTYDSNKQLSEITDAHGLTSKFTYDSGTTNINALTTGYGTTKFTSTESGLDRTLLVTFPDGAQEMAQSLGGSTAGFSDSDPASVLPTGIPEDNAYLAERNTSYWDRKAMLDAPGDPTKARVYHYLHGNNLVKSPILESIKLPLQDRTWYYYQGQEQAGFVNTDGQNMINKPSIIARVLDDGSTQISHSTYNPLGRLTQYVDPAGRTTNYLYDSNNIDLLQIRQVTGANTYDVLGTYTYNAHHQVLSLTDASGQITRVTYNAAGQPLTITDAAGEKTTWTYDSKGYPVSATGLMAGSTNKTTLTYDAFGRVATATDALGRKFTYGYDNLNRNTSITYPDGTKDQFTYSLLNLTTYTDRLGRQTKYAYNSLDQLTAATDALGRVTRYDYCKCGGLTSLTDPLGQMTRFDYDVQSRLISRTASDGTKTTYAYETNGGRLKSETDAKGQTSIYAYNPDNTLRLISHPNAQNLTSAVGYAYDPVYHRLASMTDASGTTTYTYNPVSGSTGAGRLASRQSPYGAVSFGYDVLGRLNSRAIDGDTESYAFNSLGTPTSLTDDLGITRYGYVADSRLLASVAMPNGVTETRTYQPASDNFWLKQIQYKTPGDANLSLWGYAFNAVSQITSWTQQRGASAASVYTLKYDDVDRLVSAAATNPATTYAYAYDTADNRLTEKINGTATTATYDSLNELVDAVPPPEADRAYTWNGADRLTAINYTGTSNSTQFTYDGHGRWVQIVEKTGSSVSATRRFVWDGDALRLEKNAAGQIVKRFFTEGVELVTGSNAGKYYYTRDHLGSIRELTDATGAVRALYDYDPYGRRTKVSGDLDADMGFAGLFEHAPSGLALAAHRPYDPNTGRWIGRDPIRERGGNNLYAYVGNNPVNRIDPSGRAAIVIGPIQWPPWLPWPDLPNLPDIFPWLFPPDPDPWPLPPDPEPWPDPWPDPGPPPLPPGDPEPPEPCPPGGDPPDGFPGGDPGTGFPPGVSPSMTDDGPPFNVPPNNPWDPNKGIGNPGVGLPPGTGTPDPGDGGEYDPNDPNLPPGEKGKDPDPGSDKGGDDKGGDDEGGGGPEGAD